MHSSKLYKTIHTFSILFVNNHAHKSINLMTTYNFLTRIYNSTEIMHVFYNQVLSF
jgi:hypothetical protein